MSRVTDDAPTPGTGTPARTSTYSTFAEGAGDKDREDVPTWDGSPGTWRTWLRRVDLWVESTNVPIAKRGAKLASRLRGTAFDCIEGLEMARLREEDGVPHLISLLRDRLQMNDTYMKGQLLEEFWSLHRAPGETVLPWVSRYRTCVARLRALAIDLPEDLLSWALLKKSNLPADVKHSVLSLSGGKWEMDPVSRALVTVMTTGSETRASSAQGHVSSRRYQSGSRMKPWRPSKHMPRKMFLAEDFLEEPIPEEELEEGEDRLSGEGSSSSSFEVLSEPSDVEEVEAFYSAYKEARDKQRANARARGFKPKVAFKGTPKETHQALHAGAREGRTPDREAREARLRELKSKTTCRACGARGHWSSDAERPLSKNRRRCMTAYAVVTLPSRCFSRARHVAPCCCLTPGAPPVFAVKGLGNHFAEN